MYRPFHFDIHIFPRGHPVIKQMDMVHARNYANMDFDQLQRNLLSSKAKDEAYTHGIK